MAELELKEVSFVYSDGTPFRKTAIENINLKISSGKITGIIGHTGSGKSTLVQLFNGLLKPTFGEVLLDGADIWKEPKKIRDVRFRVGLVFQYPEYQLFEETVYKDLAFGPHNMGLDENETDRRIKEAAKFCGITDDMMERSPFELSGGQRRRVAIAGVIAMEPEILILDEPAAGLDPKGREEILGGLKSYQREKNNTVLLVSHSMEDMARYSDEIVVLKGGSILMNGKTADIFSQAETLRSAGLDVPQITVLIDKLRSSGLDIPGDIYTVDGAVNALKNILSKRGRGDINA